MADSFYLDFLAISIVVVCVSAIAVMTLSTIPYALRSYRSTTGAENAYSWWLALRAFLCYGALWCSLATGLTVLVFPPESILRVYLARHLLITVIASVAVLGILGPVEKRSVERALEEESDESPSD